MRGQTKNASQQAIYGRLLAKGWREGEHKAWRDSIKGTELLTAFQPLQKQPQHRQARYGENFHRAVPPPPLGTDVDALLLMLEAEERQ